MPNTIFLLTPPLLQILLAYFSRRSHLFLAAFGENSTLRCLRMDERGAATKVHYTSEIHLTFGNSSS